MATRVVAFVATVLFAAAPANAQTPPPSPAPTATPALPSIPAGLGNAIVTIVNRITGDAVAPFAVDPNHVRGTVTFFKRFDLQVRMPLNGYRDIHLHQGTVINPRGASLAPGQLVDVQGHANPDGSIDAGIITLIHP